MKCLKHCTVQMLIGDGEGQPIKGNIVGQYKMQTVADHCFHHAKENKTRIVPLFSNPENNGLLSVCNLHFVMSRNIVHTAWWMYKYSSTNQINMLLF